MKSTDERPKVFGIGLNKTGTTTLGQCGKILGLNCTSCDRSLLKDFAVKKDFTRIRQTVSQFDLFEDWPWPLLYKDLDEMYPGSKFILTVRKSETAWLESLKKHAIKRPPFGHCRKLAYGFNYPHKHEQEHLEFYRTHNDNVRSYFKNRTSDFIEICWENGDDFDKLCKFLGCDNPDIPVPHVNKATDNQAGKTRSLIKLINRVLSSM